MIAKELKQTAYDDTTFKLCPSTTGSVLWWLVAGV